MEHCEPEDAGITPETGAGGPRIAGSSDHEQKATHYLPFVASSSSPKRSRRSVEKRVVTLPMAEADAKRTKGAGEGAPPSDTWTWRKYGQKPIKGSPYPRGYYRCSSSKGCPARKQVERSQTDPTKFVITYTCEHNHYSAQPNNNYRFGPTSSSKSNPVLARSDHFITPNTTKLDDKLLDPIIAEEPPCNDCYWFSDVGSPCTGSTDELLLGSIVGWGDMDAMMSFTSECVELSDGGGWEEEDLLFAGLGELPECRVVFRRGFLERQMVAVQGEG